MAGMKQNDAIVTVLFNEFNYIVLWQKRKNPLLLLASPPTALSIILLF